MKSLKKLLIPTCAILLLMALGCRSKNQDDRPVIAVSIEPQRQMLEQLAGDNFRIVTLMPNGENPETYEPSPARRMDLGDAKAYFITGNLLFEENLRMSERDTSKFYDTSEGIDLLYGTHTRPGGHAGFLPGVKGETDKRHLADPHIWSSVKNMRKMARNITETLIELDNENIEEYEQRYDKYVSHLDSLDLAFEKKLLENPSKSFFIWHPSLSYFARDYNLNQISFSSENKEISAERMAEYLALVKDYNVKTVIFQRELDSRQADVIKNNLGVDVVKFDGLNYDWENELSRVVDGISTK